MENLLFFQSSCGCQHKAPNHKNDVLRIKNMAPIKLKYHYYDQYFLNKMLNKSYFSTTLYLINTWVFAWEFYLTLAKFGHFDSYGLSCPKSLMKR